MKKLLALLLVLVMCVGMFAACAPAPKATVADAAEYLWSMYQTNEGKPSPADYQVVAKVIVDGVEFSVEWATNNDKITVAEGKKAGFKTIKVPTANAEEFEYKLTATIKAANGETATKEFTRKMPVVSNDGITSTPEAGVAYKLFLYQGGLLKTYYALNTTQNNENKFINTTEDAKAAADFFVEASGDGYKWYTTIDGVKTYVYAKTTTSVDNSGATKVSKYIGFNAEEGSVFTYDDKGVWMVTIENASYGVGTYGTYQTISISDSSYYSADSIGTSQYVLKFIASDVAETLVPEEGPETNTNAAEILNTLYGLANDETATGSFQLTGVITELDSFNNPTMVVTGYDDKPVYCYKLTDDRFVVGATITVTATMMKNYSGKYEFMNCVLDNIVPPAGGSDPVDPPAGDDDGDDPVTPPATTNGVELTVDSLALPSDSYTAGTATVNGVAFEFVQLGNYGNGIQMRDKNGNTSLLWNTSAFAKGIARIELVYSDTQAVTYANPDAVIFSFGNDTSVASYTTKLSTEAGVKTYTITPDVDTYTFFKLEHDLGYSFYWKSITIVYADGSTDPVDPPAGGDDGDDPVNPPVDDDDDTVVYEAVTELKNGDKIVIGAVNYGKLLSMVKTGHYNVGINYSADDFANVTDDEIFVVTINDDGSYTFTSLSGKVLAMAASYSSLNHEDPVNSTWTLEAQTNGTFYVKNNGRGNYIEWYASMNNWSTYGPANSDLFELTFYLLKDAESSDPVDPPAGDDDEGDDDACTNHVDANGDFICDTEGCDAVVEPENGSTLTIAQVKLLASLLKGNSTNWYYVVAKVTQVYNTTHGNMYITDDDVDTVIVYGSFSADGSTRYDAMTDKPKAGDTVKFYSIITWSSATSNAQLKDARIIEYTAHTCQFSQADCTTAATCSICNTTQGEALGHNYVDGTCDRCGQGQPAANNKDDFNTINAGTPNGSYMDRESTNGWVAHNAAFNGHGTGSTSNPNFPTVFEADEYALTIKGSTTDPGKITSPTLQNGIATLTFNYAHLFTEANGVNLTINIKQGDEVVATTNLVKSNAEVVKLSVNLFTWNLDTAVEGDFVIEILNNCPSNNTGNKDRVSIWNITWVNA